MPEQRAPVPVRALDPRSKRGAVPAGSVMRDYGIFAAYNAWANVRLYDAASALGAELCARPMGAFFGSILGTLNHLLVADRIWLDRFEGNTLPQAALDDIVTPHLGELRLLREAEDARIARFVGSQTLESLNGAVSYTTSTGRRLNQTLASALDHVFNHQTHHRGQVHTLLTQLGGRAAAPPLDLIAFQRDL